MAQYDYRDEQGELLYQLVRYEPKDFRQRRPAEGGGWNWSTKDVRRVLYRLQELLRSDKSKPVFVVEGEKDVERLRRLGFVATCNVGGAGKWLSDYNAVFKGRRVVILPDNDPSGWDHAKLVARELHGIAASVKIVELPDAAEHGDVSNWLDAGHTKADLLDLYRRARHYNPTRQRANGQALGADQRHPTGEKNAYKTSDKTDDDPLGTNPLAPDGSAENPLGKVTVAPFPIEVFPGTLRRYVESLATASPCPVDFPGVMILPVLATFIGRKHCIEIKASCASTRRCGLLRLPVAETARRLPSRWLQPLCAKATGVLHPVSRCGKRVGAERTRRTTTSAEANLDDRHHDRGPQVGIGNESKRHHIPCRRIEWLG